MTSWIKSSDKYDIFNIFFSISSDVFKPVRGQLGVFWALLFTYSMSALFHGLNFQLAAVLLSLGFYTYVEHSLRYKLSSAFDACILARPCPESCEHTQKGKLFYLSFFLSSSFSFPVSLSSHLHHIMKLPKPV